MGDGGYRQSDIELSTPSLEENSFSHGFTAGVCAMRVSILLQITDDQGTAGPSEEVAAFEKATERPEDLGLLMAEGKTLLAAI
jgi:hypothetical protein